ncbi:MAG: phosphatidate cytidylyltransferase [Alphaproteobacteria bacterium]|nr:phosphatidate cytidylyltransferase [Alphaproteobacteria bacterium]
MPSSCSWTRCGRISPASIWRRRYGNSRAASAATVRPLADPLAIAPKSNYAELPLRIISAIVIAPPCIAAIWLGAPYIQMIVLAAVFLMALEWARLVGHDRNPWLIGVLTVGVPQPVIASFFGSFDLALVLSGLIFLAIMAMTKIAGVPRGIWLAAGVPAIVLPALSLLFIRDHGEAGLVTALWLLAVVVATDVGAYFAGRTIGGPKLAPRISPKKTWAGLIGGMVSAGLIGAGAILLIGVGDIILLVIFSALLAVVAQIGDLSESAVKRHFGVKDSGTIIPGHGGLFDRLDGFLTTLPTVALVMALTGTSILQWQ